MFKTIYYAGEGDDQQRVSTQNFEDSAYWVELEKDEYIRVGINETNEAGESLPELFVSLEIGKNYSKEDPLWWGGTLSEFKQLMTEINKKG